MLPQSFHPIIRSWFTETYGNPTGVQAEAWPLIEKGENVLAIAPTGSGKTLTAFLSALSRFCSDGKQKYNAEKLSVLYVSPLKALNEDIKRNLLLPLAAIKTRFEKEGLQFPPVHVETRSGDTPQSARRRFFIHPPSILALTPESLAIILLNPKGRQILSNVKCLIIDEIHALIGNKRGAYLSCQIDRLSHIAGEFQRISLSATVRNPQTAADFTGGIGRKVNIASVPAEKKIEFNIEYPELSEQADDGKQSVTRYSPLINYILRRIWEGATLLVFAESRRRAERLCFFLNNEASVLFARHGNPPGREAGAAVAYPHHGSLSKELRRSVEKGLAEGRLPCVVATASLELGIDIGDIDEVVLAGSPGSVSQTLQRIGRSGHGVGQTSRGRLFAFHSMDLLIASALKSAVDEKDIEEIYPVENPQDILAQTVLALCCEKDRSIEELYSLIKTFYIFRTLNYDSYIRTVRMLAGLGENGRLRDVKPRIWLDKIEEKIGVLDGTATLLYTSSGVIANRGHYSLRLADGSKMGELDEEFVWERSIGDRFDFGARGWLITSITSEAVEVTPLERKADFIPFWKGEMQFRSKNLTERLLSILGEYNKTECIKKGLSDQAASSLKSFLDLQRSSQRGIELPDNKNIVIEIITETELNRDFCSVVLHSFRGGQINYPLSLALSAELEEIVKLRVAQFSSDNNILFLIPRLGVEETAKTLEDIVRRALSALSRTDTGTVTRAERLFRNRLESSGVFGANFREAAERSMLLPKAPFGKRTPLWIMRQRSKRLFDSVAGEDGFPVTAEAWRCCLVDTFDMNGFKDLVLAINDGSITVSFFHTACPSPFSRDVVREETNAFMYEYDERKDLAKGASATLSDKVIEEAINNSQLRPALKQEVIDNFTSRLRREKTGYAPDDVLSLSEWVKERAAIPYDEWQTLYETLPRQLTDKIDECKIKTITRNGASLASVVHREWEKTWIDEPLNLLGQWLRYEGPVSLERIRAVFGATEAEVKDALGALSEVDEVICDVEILTDPHETLSSMICDRENLELLLRISRKKERPVIKERQLELLAPFLALRQGFYGNTKENFEKSLYTWTAPVKLWETELLQARNPSYDPEKLNRMIREGQLVWYGAGNERTGFCRPEDLDLVFENKKKEPDTEMTRLIISGFFSRPRDFWEIKNKLNIDSRACAKALWHETWNGNLSADTFDPARRGAEFGYIPKEIEMPQNMETAPAFGRQRRIPGALKNLWKTGAPVHGNWFSLLMDELESPSQAEIDPIEEDSINRDRVRLLLSRRGILCRPLLEHEAHVFSWSKLLPAMRRMELAGELVTGRFFTGINSLQFASPSIAAQLEHAESINDIYWMNAADPASIAGLEIEGLRYKLCARSAGNRLYFKGAALIAVCAKNGKELQIHIGANDPDIPALIALLKIPRTRNVMPEKKIVVEKINGVEGAKSIFAGSFKESGFVSDRGKLVFW
ncbi:MAG: DEAD/DEAH box helicase [Treponema sp.]|nr:DEAD/DEAH box helicase [Treponema sp.]